MKLLDKGDHDLLARHRHHNAKRFSAKRTCIWSWLGHMNEACVVFKNSANPRFCDDVKEGM